MMILWGSDDLQYVEHDFVKSVRNKYYTKIWFKDAQTKRRIPVYDFSGLDSAALTFEHYNKEDTRWWIGGVVNTSGEKHFLVLQQFALLVDGKKVDPYKMIDGVADVELVTK